MTVYRFYRPLAFVTALVLAALAFFMIPAAGHVSLAEGEAKLVLHFVDVGQGDCTIIELPDGKTMIIDGGENDNKVKTAILKYITDNLPSGFKYFDYAILTHSDSDHCGSLDDVLGAYPARVSYRPNVEATGTNSNPYTDPGKADLTPDAVSKNTAAYAKCIKAMYVTNSDFTATVLVTDPAVDSQTITGGEGEDAYTFTFYSPLSTKYSDWNNYSPIMILSYRGFNFAMSGDAEKENETEFVKKVADARTDGVTDKYDIFTDDYCVNLIKAGHHGSRTSTSKAYIDAITTETGAKSAYYIISCGEGNSYGHPHSETVNRLADMGVPDGNVLRTDKSGDISLNVRAGEDGKYSLFYGDKRNDAPAAEGKFDFKEFFEKNKTWIIIVAVVVAVVIIIAIIVYNVHKDDKSSKSKKSGSRKR